MGGLQALSAMGERMKTTRSSLPLASYLFCAELSEDPPQGLHGLAARLLSKLGILLVFRDQRLPGLAEAYSSDSRMARKNLRQKLFRWLLG